MAVSWEQAIRWTVDGGGGWGEGWCGEVCSVASLARRAILRWQVAADMCLMIVRMRTMDHFLSIASWHMPTNTCGPFCPAPEIIEGKTKIKQKDMSMNINFAATDGENPAPFKLLGIANSSGAAA